MYTFPVRALSSQLQTKRCHIRKIFPLQSYCYANAFKLCYDLNVSSACLHVIKWKVFIFCCKFVPLHFHCVRIVRFFIGCFSYGIAYTHCDGSVRNGVLIRIFERDNNNNNSVTVSPQITKRTALEWKLRPKLLYRYQFFFFFCCLTQTRAHMIF